jgi:ubiquinone biosynthesis protein
MDWKTLTSLGRFKDIVMVLLRYGFDDLVDRLNIPGTKFMRKKFIAIRAYTAIAY